MVWRERERERAMLFQIVEGLKVDLDSHSGCFTLANARNITMRLCLDNRYFRGMKM